MKKKIFKILLGLISTIAIFASIQTVSAEYTIPIELKPDNLPFDISVEENGEVDSGETQVIKILQVISGALLYFAAPLTVIAIGMTAFNMAMGSGNSEKIETAKKQLTWAIMGLLLVILSYAVVKIVISFPFSIFG